MGGGGAATGREEVLLLSALAALCVAGSYWLRLGTAPFPLRTPPRLVGRSPRRLVLFRSGRPRHATADVNMTAGRPSTATAAHQRRQRTRVPGVSRWWAAPGEGVWPEGRLDALEMQRALERKQRARIPDALIAAVMVHGRVADQLKLTGHAVLRPPSTAAAKQAVHGTPFFEGGGIRLGKSTTLGDPYWYLSRGKGPVKGPGNPTILAYVEGEAKCPPWHSECEYAWWAHPNGGTWIRYAKEELLFDASES